MEEGTKKDFIEFIGYLEDEDIVSTKWDYPPTVDGKPNENTLLVTFNKNIYPIKGQKKSEIEERRLIGRS